MQNEILPKQTFYLLYIIKRFALLSKVTGQWTNNTAVLNFQQRLVQDRLEK